MPYSISVRKKLNNTLRDNQTYMSHYQQISTKINVFWFRRDLRIDDNSALFLALNGSLPVLPVFIFDSDILDNLNNKKDQRVNFIYQNVVNISTYLKGIGSGLLVLAGKPEDIWRKLTSSYSIDSVFFNHDYEPYARQRDRT